MRSLSIIPADVLLGGHLQPPLHVGLHRVQVAVAEERISQAEPRVEARSVEVDVGQLQLSVLQLALLISGQTMMINQHELVQNSKGSFIYVVRTDGEARGWVKKP